MSTSPKEILCEKCNRPMSRTENSPLPLRKSFGVSGVESIFSSVSFTSASPFTIHGSIPNNTPLIKIVEYECSCGWSCQKRE